MNVLKEKDKLIVQKEQQLSQMMVEYYAFDMQELRQEIETILQNESNKVTQDRDNKLKQIANSFKRIMTLAQDHVAKGSNY